MFRNEIMVQREAGDRQTGTPNGHVVSDTSVPSGNAEALTLDQFERLLLDRFATTAEVVIEAPRRTFRGTAEIRQFIHEVFRLQFANAVVVRENPGGQIASLAVSRSIDGGSPTALGSPGLPIDSVPEWRASHLHGGRRRRLSTSAQLLGAAILGVLTAVSTLIAILLYLFPDLSREPPASVGAILAEVALEERRVVSNGVPANKISYDVELAGYKEKQGSLKYAVFDAAKHQRIDPPPTADPAGPQFVTIGPLQSEAQQDRASGHFYVAIPAQAQCVFVRVYVFEDEAGTTRLDYADTVPFDTHFATNQHCASALESAR
jgi:hypothetical protein